ARLPDPRRPGRGTEGDDHRRPRRRGAASGAVGLPGAGRVPMRLLYAGADHVRGRLHPRGPCRFRCRDPRIHGGQSLPLWCLSPYRRRGSPGRQRPGREGDVMNNFFYTRASSVDEARKAAAQPAHMLLAGGTMLIDLAKCGVLRPETVVDITHLDGLEGISIDAQGATIGALAKMGRVADHPGIRAQFPAVAEALQLAASAQLR